MQLHSIRGGNNEDLYNKKYTIGVGISLGNKWFTVENIVELVKWSLLYTKDNVIVYVADSIHAINLEVRNRISSEKASIKADKMGDDILENTKKELLKTLSFEEFKKIKFVKWNQLVDQSYNLKLNFLNEFYENNTLFKDQILSIIKNTIKKEKRKFTEQEIHRFASYLIAETPELLNRVDMDGSPCDAYAYPFNGEFVALIEKIQKGEIYSQIKEQIMDTAPKVFLEVR